MYDQTEQAIMAPLGTLSLDKLAELAIAEKLIDRFDVAGNRATILQRDKRFSLQSRQASTFLIGMLRGRSWYKDPQVESATHSPTLSALAPTSAAIESEEGGSTRSIEATLDALLTVTKDIGVILGYEKNAGNRIVQIDIPACSSVFSYVDAVGYLFDCVQHEVRSTTEAA